MSFNTPSGTRGARQPSSGRLLRWFNKTAVSRMRRSGGTFMGMDTLILTTVGAKSGVVRTNPVAYVAETEDSWLIVASAVGAPNNPAWYYNLAAHPDQVQVEHAGQTIPVTAEQLHGEERDIAWRRVVGGIPRFGQYQERTDRELPVIRLTRRDS